MLGKMASVSSGPAEAFMPGRPVVMKRVMSPWEKGDTQLVDC